MNFSNLFLKFIDCIFQVGRRKFARLTNDGNETIINLCVRQSVLEARQLRLQLLDALVVVWQQSEAVGKVPPLDDIFCSPKTVAQLFNK